MPDRLQEIEAEVAKIHDDFAKGHARLAVLVAERDQLLAAPAATPGGTTIAVPAATVKFKGH